MTNFKWPSFYEMVAQALKEIRNPLGWIAKLLRLIIYFGLAKQIEGTEPAMSLLLTIFIFIGVVGSFFNELSVSSDWTETLKTWVNQYRSLYTLFGVAAEWSVYAVIAFGAAGWNLSMLGWFIFFSVIGLIGTFFVSFRNGLWNGDDDHL